MTIGVAISTTGDEHRLGFLETCVEHWIRALPSDAALVVTVDGDDYAVECALRIVGPLVGHVWQVGQGRGARDGRQGVAVNKNTGLALLMDAGVDDLFLSDDDIWPLTPEALRLHTRLAEETPHSMVCWGKHRYDTRAKGRAYAQWTWPRGSLLYATRAVVERVGGMVEAFGPGGHEHVEWSRRIHQAGLTPALYPTPVEYTETTRAGMASGMTRYWHAEDAPRRGELVGNLRKRRLDLTSVRREDGDWAIIERVMGTLDGRTEFVPFYETANGRGSATLYPYSSRPGAEGDVSEPV